MYLIGGYGGSGHNFIASLIIHSITGDTKVIQYDEELGHAHGYVVDYISKHFGEYDLLQNGALPKNSSASIDKIKQIQNRENLILFYPPQSISFSELLEALPDCKIVFITMRNQDRIIAEHNHFYKNVKWCPAGSRLWLEYMKHYVLARVENNLPRKTVTSFDDLTTEEIYLMLEHMVNFRANIMDIGFSKHSVFEEIDKLEDADKSKVLVIEYDDMINDMEKTLGIITSLTNTPVSDSLVESYNNYIQLQTIIRTKYNFPNNINT